jgi:membrane-associated HD superfamily phosphohydrolase
MNALEQQLVAAARRPQAFATTERVQPDRLNANLDAVHLELDSPREPRLARALRRVGVPDLSIPLVTATPALRRSWFLAVGIALLFALGTASNNTGAGPDRIAVFLTLAPLLPLLGVALAFGRGVDPTHELVLAAPRDTFVVFLVRSLTVLTASSALLLVASLMLPAGGLYRVAWLLPSLATAGLTMALSSRHEPRRVAAIVAAGWVLLSVTLTAALSVEAMFGAVTQAASVVVAALAGGYLFGRRALFDT